jgi:hypothetical protein
MGYSAQPQFQRLDNSCFPKVPGEYLPGELKKWTVRRKIERENSGNSIPKERSVTGRLEPFKKQPEFNFPCPIKWRYKFWDTIKSFGGNQPNGPLAP